MAKITAIKPLTRDPNLRSIYVDGRKLATLRASIVERLGIAVDRAWTEALSNDVERACAIDRARKSAMARLGRRAYGRDELRGKLVDSGFDQAIAEKVIDDLTREGWLDDEAYAADLIEEVTRKRTVGRTLLEEKLRKRSLPDDVIRNALRTWESQTGTPADEAMTLAERSLKKSATEPPEKRLRRIGALLHRRGFEDGIVRDTLETLASRLGVDPVS